MNRETKIEHWCSIGVVPLTSSDIIYRVTQGHIWQQRPKLFNSKEVVIFPYDVRI